MIEYQIVYSEMAYQDLRSIYTYILEKSKSEKISTDQISRIQKRIGKLDLFPERNSKVEWEPWLSMKMHFLPIDKYIAYYLVDSTELCVNIVRIFYSGRDIKNIVLSEKEEN